MIPVTPFTNDNRKAVLTIDLVTALADTMQADGAMPQKTKRCIDRINIRIKNLQHIIYGGPTLVLGPVSHRKYKKKIKSMHRLIKRISTGECLDLDFFNSILALAADAWKGSKNYKNPRLRREWGYLNQSLFTLYGHVDPDLDQFSWMKLGNNLATQFKRVMVSC